MYDEASQFVDQHPFSESEADAEQES